jgi:predicted small metal-binding protein
MCDERKILSLSSPMPMGSYLTLEGTITVVATDPASANAAALSSDCRRMAAGPTGYYEEDRKGGIMAEPINLKCPSCGQILAAADESGLVNVLQEHLYEEHALDMTRERVRENVVAQLRAFDGYNARPISGA